MAFHITSIVKEPVKLFGHVWLFATSWTVAYQAAPSVEFSRQENWNGLPFPSPGDLPNPGIKPRSPTLQADALPSEPPGKPTDTRMRLSKSRHIKIEKAINYNLICWFFGGKFNPKARHFGTTVKLHASKVFRCHIYCDLQVLLLPFHSHPLLHVPQATKPNQMPF